MIVESSRSFSNCYIWAVGGFHSISHKLTLNNFLFWELFFLKCDCKFHRNVLKSNLGHGPLRTFLQVSEMVKHTKNVMWTKLHMHVHSEKMPMGWVDLYESAIILNLNLIKFICGEFWCAISVNRKNSIYYRICNRINLGIALLLPKYISFISLIKFVKVEWILGRRHQASLLSSSKYFENS